VKAGDLVRHRNLPYRYGIILSTTTYSNGALKYHSVHWFGMRLPKSMTSISDENFLELLSEG